jgi:hypothetical protein
MSRPHPVHALSRRSRNRGYEGSGASSNYSAVSEHLQHNFVGSSENPIDLISADDDPIDLISDDDDSIDLISDNDDFMDTPQFSKCVVIFFYHIDHFFILAVEHRVNPPLSPLRSGRLPFSDSEDYQNSNG